MKRRMHQREATETTTGPGRRTWSFSPRSIGEGPLPPGPWDNEPDKIQWVDPTTNLDCLMVRNPWATWCGYVGVPQDHAFYRKSYEVPEVWVHGGLTFAELCSPGETLDGICHIAEPGRETKPWWFGFDCAHGEDLQPGMQTLMENYGFNLYGQGVYRDEAYVHAQVTSLAWQLHEMRNPVL